MKEVLEMEIRLAKENDAENWMSLVNKVKDSFPGLETAEAMEEHRHTVLDFMSKSLAVCAETENKIVGTLLFSKQESMLCFLAVDPDFRRRHIAEKMVSYMLAFMEGEKDITVTTYREGVPEGIPARAFYQRLGFEPGRLTEEFGSPVQEFVLKRELPVTDDPSTLLNHISKIHTTELGAARIKKNLNLETADEVEYCKNLILHPDCKIFRQGKNWYCETKGIRITVNANSYTIITAHRQRE